MTFIICAYYTLLICIFRNISIIRSLKETEQSDNFTEYLADIGDDGREYLVFGLKPDMTVFFVESLNCHGITDESYHIVAVIGCGLLLDEDEVFVMDAGILHAFALHTEHEHFLTIGKYIGRKRKVAFIILNG